MVPMAAAELRQEKKRFEALGKDVEIQFFQRWVIEDFSAKWNSDEAEIGRLPINFGHAAFFLSLEREADDAGDGGE